ncbi:hypothetical protein JB92DRAFT_2996870 [Gautieria morchelliformis]|nr:hypothetical protein JB92DRAFT_2996870 [Gautieria morchelliformis]
MTPSSDFSIQSHPIPSDAPYRAAAPHIRRGISILLSVRPHTIRQLNTPSLRATGSRRFSELTELTKPIYYWGLTRRKFL